MAVSLQKRGRIWHCRITGEFVAGIEYRHSLKTNSKKEAERLAYQIEARLRREFAEGINEFQTPRKQAIMFSDYSQEFFEYCENRRLSPQTIRKYHEVIESAKQIWGSLALHMISTSHVEQLLSGLLDKGCSSTTRNIHLRHLKALFSRAVQQAYIARNPAKGIKEIRIAQKPPVYLKSQEIEKLLDAAHIHSSEMCWFCLLGIFAGLRYNEIVNTRWEWLRFEERNGAGNVVVPGQDPISGFRTKSSRGRTIPMSSRIREELIDIRKPEGFLFRSRNNSRGLNKYRYDPKKGFAAVVKAAGLPNKGPRKITPHVLRHTFASIVANATGSNLFKLKEWMGHANVSTTQIYAHLFESDDSVDFR